MKKEPSLILSLIPVFFLITMLSLNVVGVFGDDALGGPNQYILLLSGALTALLAIRNGVSYDQIMEGIKKSIANTVPALLILLLIGSLAGVWMLSGVIPTMIYYGLQLLNPAIFLPATAIICALVSLATGSSWGTTATVGIALVGIGDAMQISSAMAAGAVISGAYFGDKISPLSDTTNLAPSMAGTDLFTHIKYMLYTTVPSFVLALIIFSFLSWNQTSNGDLSQLQPILSELDSLFNISPWLFLVPLSVIGLIVLKTPALPAILAGTLIGGIFALLFQSDLMLTLSESNALTWQSTYRLIMNSFTIDVSYPAQHPVLSSLLETGGMFGMWSTVLLVITAMIFGGAMEAGGFLQCISRNLLKLAKGTASLIATTAGTCVFVNVTASDQYLAIVLPGRMYADAYKDAGLAPENLSRTLEDSGTVTSVLVPWNTCGAYQSGILNVDTMAYVPYAFFNLISPFMTLLFAIFNVKIKKLVQ